MVAELSVGNRWREQVLLSADDKLALTEILVTDLVNMGLYDTRPSTDDVGSSSSAGWLFWNSLKYVGTWQCCRASSWRRICTPCHLAMDFLHQSCILCHFTGSSSDLSQT